jgi:hypothetical protein
MDCRQDVFSDDVLPETETDFNQNEPAMQERQRKPSRLSETEKRV